MLGGLLFIVCVVLRFHYHDSIPWYIWVVAAIALCVSFGATSDAKRWQGEKGMTTSGAH